MSLLLANDGDRFWRVSGASLLYDDAGFWIDEVAAQAAAKKSSWKNRVSPETRLGVDLLVQATPTAGAHELSVEGVLFLGFRLKNIIMPLDKSECHFRVHLFEHPHEPMVAG